MVSLEVSPMKDRTESTRNGSIGLVSLALIVPLGAVTAAAQPEAQSPARPRADSGPEDEGRSARARQHFEAGMRHFNKRSFREAIQEFRLAAQLVPSADLWFNIARAHEELSEYQEAADHYSLYLRDRVDPPDRAQVDALIKRLKERAEEARRAQTQRPTEGTLRVRSNVKGADVEVDGKRSGKTPLNLALTLPPGRHALEVAREGYIPFRSKVGVRAGQTTAAYADLVPETRYRAVRGRRVWTWVVGGLAAGAAVASLGLGIRAARLDNDGDLDGARDWARYSDFALGGALVLGVGAVILYFVEGRAVATERVGPDGRVVASR